MGFWNWLLGCSLPLVPRSLMAWAARRFVAGESRDDVLRLVEQIHARGLLVTVDLLGENLRSRDETKAVTREYLELLEAFAERAAGAHISVKLTHLGLRLGEELAYANVASLVERAAELGSFVRIDMEDSTTTDATLRIFRRLREKHEEVGVAVQAYLHRSEDDVSSLLPLRPNLRICKGIYQEPAEIAWRDTERIRQSFLSLVRMVLRGGGYAAIATHDRHLIDESLALASDHEGRYEFQMLHGVGHDLRPRILTAGHLLRIYCPYGPDWYEYSLRRLKENPRVLGHVLRQLWRT